MECDEAFAKNMFQFSQKVVGTVLSFTYSAVTNKNSKYKNVIIQSQIAW